MLYRTPLSLVLVISLLHTLASAQWVQANGPYGGSIRCFAVSGTNLFAGTSEGGVFLSTDNGASWCAASIGLTNTQIEALAVRDTYLFAGTSNGVFRSSDHGTSWCAVNSGLRNFPVYSLAVSGTDLFAGLAVGVFRSTDDGASWTSANEGVPLIGHQGFFDPIGITCFASIGPSLFAGTAGKGLIVSTNSGASWDTAYVWQTENYVKALAVGPSAVRSGATNLFAGTYGGVFLSTDTGTTWIAAHSGLSNPYVVTFAVSSNPGGGTGLYAGTYGGGVFVSTNDGTMWTSVNTGMTDSQVVSFAITGMDLFVGTYSGSVWRRPLSEMLPASVPRLLFPPDHTVFYGGPFTFRWSSVDGAVLYHLQSTGDSLFQTNLFVNDSALVDTSRWSVPTDSAFTSPTGGIYFWRIRAKTATGWSAWSQPGKYILSPCDVAESKTVPAEFCLEQNHPNPFNPSTTITYELPKSSIVRLNVFDILGREVSVLVDERREAGVHEVKFDGSNLASGVYFYRLQAGDFVAIKRLLFLK